MSLADRIKQQRAENPNAIQGQTVVETKHIFSTPHSEAYSIHLASGTVTAKDGVLKLSQKQKDELDELLATGRPDISQNLVYIDVNAAEAVAKEHMKKSQAGKGTLTTAQGAERQNRTQDYNTVNLDGAAPEIANPSMQQNAALVNAIREASGSEEEDDARRKKALELQKVTTLKVEEEEAFHAEDSSLKVDPKTV